MTQHSKVLIQPAPVAASLKRDEFNPKSDLVKSSLRKKAGATTTETVKVMTFVL